MRTLHTSDSQLNHFHTCILLLILQPSKIQMNILDSTRPKRIFIMELSLLLPPFQVSEATTFQTSCKVEFVNRTKLRLQFVKPRWKSVATFWNEVGTRDTSQVPSIFENECASVYKNNYSIWKSSSCKWMNLRAWPAVGLLYIYTFHALKYVNKKTDPFNAHHTITARIHMHINGILDSRIERATRSDMFDLFIAQLLIG